MIEFIFLAIVFALCIILISFFGWLGHWFIHQKFSGSFYKAHMNHHQIQYPVNDLISDKYRTAGKDGTSVLFIILFSPIITLISIISLYGIISLPTLITITLATAIIGISHNYFHDQFHITHSFWLKFNSFEELRKYHFIHHIDMNKNYGIITFIWDKAFGTFTTKKDN